MQVGFFSWPFTPEIVRQMAEAADRYGFDMFGIADTPGNAMDPWVAMALAAQAAERTRLAMCVTNLTARHPATTAAAIASIELIAPGRAVLGLGTGHSGTRNLGVGNSPIAELEDGVGFIRALLAGEAAQWQGGPPAQLAWVRRPSPVFLSASGPKALAAAGRCAEGCFINFGLLRENLEQSESAVTRAAIEAGRDPVEVETWQIAALDCNRDHLAARTKIGAILAFMAGGYVLRSGDLRERGVPEELHGAIRELRRRYSTRPGAADAALVAELGLFDYLSERFAIWGTPEQCRDQLLRAKAAGLKRVMFTVSIGSDPVGTVELFGREVLPALR
ncbi:MAG: LLM class flavin-dependent oxidoreductase [Alphaproteobacteria bacterium]|nr:LLM class flavin-dependent oxidoreductase [Alphaproteobacteria bacterium]